MPWDFQSVRQWSIRTKLAAILSVVVLANVTVDLLIQQRVILPSFAMLEQDEAREAAKRCARVIAQEASHLRVFAEDWSAWDDTYQFAVDRNAEYIAKNLTAATFRSARLDAICILNTQGQTVWAGVRKAGTSTEVARDEALEREFASTPAIAHQSTSIDEVSGIFLSSHGPMIVASLPILSNEGRGPSRGAFVMGRNLDPALVALIGEQAGVTLEVWQARGAALSPEQASALAQITPETPSVVRAVSDKTLTVFSVFPDVSHAPGLLLGIGLERDITPKGVLATRYALISSLVSGLLILVVLVLSLHVTVVAPIRALTRRVMGFSAGQRRPAGAAFTRGDEVTLLLREFKEMKSRLAADMEERRLSEARMRAILVSAPDGILTVDQSGRIESVNRAAETMFGYHSDELVGKNWRILVSGEFRQHDDTKVASAIRERTAAEGFLGYEVAGVRKDGTVFPMHVTASAVDLGGERVILGIVRDITELTRMHERVLHAEHLATIGEMGASVAHEIKNPIAGISGAIQVLRDSLAPEDARRDVIKEILEQVARVDLTVRELLMFARPWSPETKVCAVWPLVSRVVDRAKAQSAFETVAFEVAGDAGATAQIDEFLVEQVFWNLFVNGAQAMPNGGRILCAITQARECVQITISDTGSGFDADVQDNIFRPFFTTKTRGTGLGLAVSRQIMEAHGGTIAIESERGAGTRVTLTLPRAA